MESRAFQIRKHSIMFSSIEKQGVFLYEMQLMRQGDGHNPTDREPRSMQQVHQEETVSSDMGGLCELCGVRSIHIVSDACEVWIHMTTTEKTIYEKALEKWGLETQILMCIEELSELIHALVKYGRKINGSSKDKIAEEIADVELMIEQIKVALNIQKLDIENLKLKKIKRLEGYLNA